MVKKIFGVRDETKKSTMIRYSCLLLLLPLANISAFSAGVTLPNKKSKQCYHSLTRIQEAADDAVASIDKTSTMAMPLSYAEMVRQAASAMRDAYEIGIDRQIVRVLLPRDTSSTQLGVLSEGILDVESQNIVLVPPDESWQGGIMQLYRSASPTCKDALRLFTKDRGGVLPRIEEDRSVDESGVDGVGLLKADLGDNLTANCFIQPSQETIDCVEPATKKAGLVLLLNPQWRLTDDAFDKASRDDGFFGTFASFLGGKGGTLRKLDEMGFEAVYNLEGYVCRGYNVRLVKRFDSDYVIFAEKETDRFERVGTIPERPTYQEVEQMLVDRGYGFKYAQNMGM